MGRSVLQWACGWAPGEYVYQVFVRNYLHVVCEIITFICMFIVLTLDGTAVGFFVGAELGEDEGVLVEICFCTKKTEV